MVNERGRIKRFVGILLLFLRKTTFLKHKHDMLVMRQIQIVVPDEEVKRFMHVLTRFDKNPLHTKATGPFDTIIVQVKDELVDDVVEILRSRGLEEKGSIFIMPPGISITKKEEVSEEKKKKIAPRVELIAKATESSELTRSFFYLTIISAFVATLGLLFDSTAVVIGAMVIAPLLGPSISICVSTVLGEAKMFRASLLNLFIGLAIAIMVSTVTAWATINSGLIPPLLAPEIQLPKEILERTDLNVLFIGLALASGAAGAYSFAERKGELLVGVMIAVALIPPAGVAGIGMALLDSEIFLGATLLLLVNVICINIAGTLVLWKIGVRPTRIFKEIESEKRVKRRVVTTAIILLVISAFFVYSTYQTYVEFQFKESIQEEINDIAESIQNVSDVEVQSINIDGSKIEVEVTLSFSSGNLSGNIAEIIKEGLEEKWADYDFAVEVRIENIQKSGD